MARLPLSLRATALLRLVEGLSCEEAAGILGISAEAARMRLSRARALMAAVPLPPDEARPARTSLAEGYHFLAGLLLTQGKEAQSDRAILRALDFDPDTAYNIWLNTGSALGRPDYVAVCGQAIRVARQAVTRWPDEPTVILTLGCLEKDLRRNLKAAERLWCAAPADRERIWRGTGGSHANVSATARCHLALLYCESQPRRALSLLEPLTTRHPDWQFAAITRAYALAVCGEPAARAWAERAQALAMAVPAPHTRWWRIGAGTVREYAAEVFKVLGDWDQAARCLRAADRLFPADFPRTRP